MHHTDCGMLTFTNEQVRLSVHAFFAARLLLAFSLYLLITPTCPLLDTGKCGLLCTSLVVGTPVRVAFGAWPSPAEVLL